MKDVLTRGIMRRVTRAQYHIVVYMLKRDSVTISVNKMAEAMDNSNTHDFVTESRKLKGQNINLSKTIDNASNDADIANLFGKIKNMMNYIIVCLIVSQIWTT